MDAVMCHEDVALGCISCIVSCLEAADRFCARSVLEYFHAGVLDSVDDEDIRQ
jgi:hypothetical protein